MNGPFNVICIRYQLFSFFALLSSCGCRRDEEEEDKIDLEVALDSRSELFEVGFCVCVRERQVKVLLGPSQCFSKPRCNYFYLMVIESLNIANGECVNG